MGTYTILVCRQRLRRFQCTGIRAAFERNQHVLLVFSDFDIRVFFPPSRHVWEFSRFGSGRARFRTNLFNVIIDAVYGLRLSVVRVVEM